MAHFAVEFRFSDRKMGPTGNTIRLEATNQPVAIAKATRQYWKTLTTKERFDAGKKMTVVCIRYDGSADAN